MSKLIMGYWDCPFCGSKEIRGDVVNCPSCGRARGEVQFYVKGYTEGTSLMEDEVNQLDHVDDETAASISKNPDWYCSFCNSLNSDNAQFCGNCGASREDSESNYFEMLQKKQEKEAAEAAAQRQNQPQAARSRKPLFILLAVIAAIVLFFVFMNGNKTAGDLKVTSLNWVRTISIEENRMFSESGWTLPQGAEQTGTKQELHHYDKVPNGTQRVPVTKYRQVFDHNEYIPVDNGNGTFSTRTEPVYRTESYTDYETRTVYKDVPRYATKYYYNIWRWVPSRSAKASGDSHDVYWPDVILSENEREGGRAAEYRFTVENPKKNGETSTYRLAESDWNNINVGDSLFITAKRSGANPYISDEKGNKIADLVREK